MEVTIIGSRDNDLAEETFDSTIELLPTNLHLEESTIHFTIAEGFVASVQLQVPGLGLISGAGFGARYDVIRIDTKFGDFPKVNEKCEGPPKDSEPTPD